MIGLQGAKFIRSMQTSVRKQRGFTLLELIIVITLMSVLSTAVLGSMWYYEEYAEKSVMDITVRYMRNGLRLRVADLMMKDRMDEMGSVLDDNPISWLETPPQNYIGQLDKVNSRSIPPGSWYFDMARKELVYFPKHHQFFEPGPSGETLVRYRVTAVTHSHQVIKNNSTKVEGISLTLVNPYKWDVPIDGEKSPFVVSHRHGTNAP